jgi:hypothetical protein
MKENEILSENADLLMGMENVPLSGGIEVPNAHRCLLENARREALSARGESSAVAETKIVRPVFLRTVLQAAAAVLLVAGLYWQLRPQPVRTARVVVTSPGDEIQSTRPRIAWTNRDAPGQRYDVWILPGSGDPLTVPALFKKENVVSPVEFARLESVKGGAGVEAPALEPGGEYRVLVCLAGAGRMAGVPVNFRTVKSAK